MFCHSGLTQLYIKVPINTDFCVCFLWNSCGAMLFEGQSDHLVPSTSKIFLQKDMFIMAERMIGQAFLHSGPCLTGLSPAVLHVWWHPTNGSAQYIDLLLSFHYCAGQCQCLSISFEIHSVFGEFRTTQIQCDMYPHTCIRVWGDNFEIPPKNFFFLKFRLF